MPRVYIMEQETPNAFATGRNPEHAAVAVTTGIMKILDRNELSGVIAHELSHIQNRDTLIGTVAATIFAIVQEAVTNAKKHASASDVWLRLQPDDGWLQVTVEDNGAGFDSDAVQQNYDRKGSIGLLSMRERAELIDAQFRIESCNTPPQTGTRIILRVPVAEQAQPEASD